MRTNKVWRQEDQSGISYLFDGTKKYGLALGLPKIWWIPGPSGGAWDVPRASAYHLATDILGQEGIAGNMYDRETNSLQTPFQGCPNSGAFVIAHNHPSRSSNYPRRTAG